MYRLESFNLELTTKCPLRCPQCYCTLEGGKDLSKETAIRMIREAAELGAEHVELSGGETLCYPYLTELVREARKNGIIPNIAISGWHFDRKKAEELMEAGIGGIFVSINAPTPEQNALTRDGFEYAIQALELLASMGFEETYINWVMHRDTADTLPEMVELVEPYHPKGLVIMTPKPDAAHTFTSFPSAEQMEKAASFIRKYNHSVKLFVESCFSPLLALLSQNGLWGNMNYGYAKGCSAGLVSISINVDGLFSPCRHLDYFESFDSIKDYWEQSETLRTIRSLTENATPSCATCEFLAYCRPCLAINSKLHGELRIGNTYCSLGEKYPRVTSVTRVW